MLRGLGEQEENIIVAMKIIIKLTSLSCSVSFVGYGDIFFVDVRIFAKI